MKHDGGGNPAPSLPLSQNERPVKMKSKPTLADLRAALRSAHVERDAEIDMILCSILARSHCLLLGPPGTGKSHLARSVSRAIGARYFGVQLHQQATEDEIFGPVDLPQWQSTGIKTRRAGNFLPGAQVAFLDEVYKAGGAVLNPLLRALADRLVSVDGVETAIPLVSVIAASNEGRQDDSLEALDDRFLCRAWVREIDDDAAWISMCRDSLPPEPDPIPWLVVVEGIDETTLRAWRDSPILTTYRSIVRACRDKRVPVSDRASVWAWRLVAAHSVLRGAEKIEACDLDVLRFAWAKTEAQAAIVVDVVRDHAAPWLREVADVRSMLAEQRKAMSALAGRSYASSAADLGRISGMLADLLDDAIPRLARDSGDDGAATVAALRAEIVSAAKEAARSLANGGVR